VVHTVTIIFIGITFEIASKPVSPRRMIWVGHVARMGDKRNSYKILVGKPEGKREATRKTTTYVGGQH
jgi:hypothetical protein